jgi:hypothetical protein
MRILLARLIRRLLDWDANRRLRYYHEALRDRDD